MGDLEVAGLGGVAFSSRRGSAPGRSIRRETGFSVAVSVGDRC